MFKVQKTQGLISVTLILRGSCRATGPGTWRGVSCGPLVSYHRPISRLVSDVIDDLHPTVRQQYVIGPGGLHVLPHLAMAKVQARRCVLDLVRKLVIRWILIRGHKFQSNCCESPNSYRDLASFPSDNFEKVLSLRCPLKR